MSQQVYTDEELIYAAGARCDCGAGFAYPRHTTSPDGVFRMANAWECGDILTGRAVQSGQPGAVTHSGALSFAFYSVKSETQSEVRLGHFATTRPGGREAFDQANAAWNAADKRVADEKRDRLGRVVREAWVAYCQDTGDTKPSHIAPWETLSEHDKEADRRIADAVKAALERKP